MMINNDLLLHLTETESTNAYLKNLGIESPLDEFFTVYTDFQTAGRGQRGNGWESEIGKNLLFSTVLYPTHMLASEAFVVSQMMALAIKNTLSKYAKHISIKWSNDIYWKEKKLVGVLIENEISGRYLSKTIIGVGINLNQEEFVSNAPNPISLKQITGGKYDPKQILIEILNELSNYYQQKEGWQSIQKEYKASLFRKDGFHLYEDSNGKFYAQIAGVEANGLLVLQLESGEIRRYAFKEVKYLF